MEDLTRQQEVERLYKKASQIYIHEMTEDEWRFIRNLAFEDRNKLSEDAVKQLRSLVERKGLLSPRPTAT